MVCGINIEINMHVHMQWTGKWQTRKSYQPVHKHVL